MSLVSTDEIVALARSFAGKGDCALDDDLLGAFQLEGDDANEFLEDFAETYQIDMSSFLWYFHYNANEAPIVESHWPYSMDGEKLHRIPLTPDMLANAANSGVWSLEYPEHVVKTPFPASYTALFLRLCAIFVLIFGLAYLTAGLWN